MTSLLPYNATKLERVIEEAIRYNIDTSILAGFKFQTSGDNLNLSLDWEYALSQINVDDFRLRVIEGLKFHRLQGTVYSLRQAFSWYGFNNIQIEEEVPGKHFAEFQVGLEEIPNNLDIEKIIKIAEFAAPLRSRLSRMYNNLYDVRRFVLDESDWGSFLSDHSGNQLYEGSPKFSFGRVNNFSAAVIEPSYEYYAVRVNFAYARYVDGIYRLDWVTLDESEVGTINHDMSRHVYRYMFNTNFPCENIDNVFDTRTVARALPVLSEDAVLGDINTCFSGGYELSDEDRFELSFHYLSEHPVQRNVILVSDRQYRIHTTYVLSELDRPPERGYKTNRTFFMCNPDYTVETYGQKFRFTSATYEGNNIWNDQVYPDIPWNEQRNNLGRIV